MKFKLRKRIGKIKEKRAKAHEHVAAALLDIQDASREAATVSHYEEGLRRWIERMLPAFEKLGIRPPYFRNLSRKLSELSAGDPAVARVAHATSAHLEAAQTHLKGLHRKARSDYRKELAVVAKSMTTPALQAQVQSHKALLQSAEKTKDTAQLRRKIKAELGAFERELKKRDKPVRAPKPKKEPRPKAAKAPRAKKPKAERKPRKPKAPRAAAKKAAPKKEPKPRKPRAPKTAPAAKKPTSPKTPRSRGPSKGKASPFWKYKIITVSGTGLPAHVDASGYDTRAAAKSMAEDTHKGEYEIKAYRR